MNKIKCFLLLIISINIALSCGIKKNQKSCDAYGNGKFYNKSKR